MTRWILLISAFALLGCEAFFPDEGKRQAREHRHDCQRIQIACLDVCKDHVTEPTIVDLGANQIGKTGCLRLCFDEYRQCLGGS